MEFNELISWFEQSPSEDERPVGGDRTNAVLGGPDREEMRLDTEVTCDPMPAVQRVAPHDAAS